MKEIWRNIKNYEGLYQVSNIGRMKSLKYGKERVLKQTKNNFGYLFVNLCKDGVPKQFKVHRLVAEAFIPKVEGKEFIDHINTDRTDNRVENLRWCTRQENNSNPLTRQKYSEANKGNQYGAKPIIGINKITGEKVSFPCATEAQRVLGIHSSAICNCIKGRYKSAGNYYWYYA